MGGRKARAWRARVGKKAPFPDGSVTFLMRFHLEKNSVGEICTVVDVAPHFMGWSELRMRYRSCRYENDDNDYRYHVETGPQRIEDGDPFGWHAADAALDDHEESGKEEHLVVRRYVICVGYRPSSKNHCRQRIVD